MDMDPDPTALVSDMLENLCIANTEDDRKKLLEQARPHLLSPDASVKYKHHLEKHDIGVIFQCLNNSKDKHMIHTTCEILARICEFVDAGIIIEKYAQAHFHFDDADEVNHEVKEVLLKFINKSLEQHQTVLFNHQNILVSAMKCLIDQDLSLSKQSYKLIRKLATQRTSTNQGVAYLFIEPYVSVVGEMLQVRDDALMLRVLELLVDICSESQEHLEM